MTKEELIAKLHEIREKSEREKGHMQADDALIEFINDSEITEAYESISKWYA